MIASRKALIVVAALVAVMLGLPWGGAAPAASEQPIAVTSANPPSGDQATLSLDVVIGGKSFKNGAKAAFFKTGTTDPAGVTVKSTKYVSATQIVATIDIADTAALAQFDIQVQNTDGRTGKGTELFSVTVKKIDPCTAPDPAPSPSWYVSTSGTVPGALDSTLRQQRNGEGGRPEVPGSWPQPRQSHRRPAGRQDRRCGQLPEHVHARRVLELGDRALHARRQPRLDLRVGRACARDVCRGRRGDRGRGRSTRRWKGRRRRLGASQEERQCPVPGRRRPPQSKRFARQHLWQRRGRLGAANERRHARGRRPPVRRQDRRRGRHRNPPLSGFPQPPVSERHPRHDLQWDRHGTSVRRLSVTKR